MPCRFRSRSSDPGDRDQCRRGQTAQLADQLIDGRWGAVRHYLRHFWSHWSGPDFEPDNDRLDHLVPVYGASGAFSASIAWYRAGAGAVARSVAEQAPSPNNRLTTRTTVLWPEHDPLFPPTWADRIDEFFADASLEFVSGAGHFVPVEAAESFSAALLAEADRG